MRRRKIDPNLRARDVYNRKAAALVCTVFSMAMMGFGLYFAKRIHDGSDYYKSILAIVVFLLGIGVALIKFILQDLEDNRKKVADFLEELNNIYRLYNESHVQNIQQPIKAQLELLSRIERLSTLARIGHFWDYYLVLRIEEIQAIFNQTYHLVTDYAKTHSSVVVPTVHQTISLFNELSQKYEISNS